MDSIKSYLNDHSERFISELMDLLRIPSISADSRFKEDVKKTAESIADHLNSIGMSKVEIFPTEGHPIVYGEKIISEDKPTVMIYGHYDVQPPDPLDLWDNPPFEPIIKKTEAHPQGAIFARGSCDDKGQVFMHIKAIEILNSMGELPCNVKFLIEGEEEIGSRNLETFVKNHRDLLTSDIILVSDTSIVSNDCPSITVGLRGLSYLEVEVVGPNRDLHSGVYGGAVANPVNVLCQMIASLHDENGKVTVKGFYDKVEELSAEYRNEMNKRPFSYENYCKDLEINATRGENGYTVIEQVSIRPTLDVNGIWGGYIGEGAKTVLPSKAFAKISMRLVPHQISSEITELFKAHFEAIAPECVKVKVMPHHGGEAAVVSTESIGYAAASKAMEEAFGKKPIPTREGGSIPIVAMFKKILGTDTILMGFGLDSDAIHSPNEHYGIFNYLKGIDTIPRFHQYFAEMNEGKV
ncbi:MAG: dipeptidase [Bacteroidia bacterium]|nr:dipeptidase [Bacteroidia bacterium]